MSKIKKIRSSMKTLSVHTQILITLIAKGCMTWRRSRKCNTTSTWPLLPAPASEQGNVIGSVRIYIYII